MMAKIGEKLKMWVFGFSYPLEVPWLFKKYE